MRTGDIWTRIPAAATPPPVEQTFDKIVLTTMAPTGANSYVCLAQLYFGTSGSTSGFYSNKTTFLADHPGLTLQPFTRATPPAACTPVTPPAYSGITSIVFAGNASLGGIYDETCGTEPWDYLFAGAGDAAIIASITITFSTAINAVGFNVENFGVTTTTYAVAFYDGVTLLDSEVRPAANYPPGLAGFAGYSTAS